MSFATFLSLRNSNLAQFTAQTIQGSTITTVSTAVASTIVVSSMRSNIMTMSSLTVSSINGVLPGISAFSTLGVSSITTSMTQYADNSQTISANGTLDYTTFGLNLVQTAATTQTTYAGYALSATGQYQTACYGSNASGGVYYSNNYGTTWSSATITAGTNAAYADVVMSASGQYQVLGVNGNGGQIYVSSNYGATWTVVASSYTGIWNGFCVSASGQYMTGVLYNSTYTSYIYYSTNYGATWTQATGPAAGINWLGVCCSASGQYQTAVSNGSGMWISTNYGASWALVAGSNTGVWIYVCCSASGQYQTVAVLGGSIYRSTDYGVTWAIISGTSATNWNTVACSASGQYQLAGISTGTVYYSTNYGATWTTTGITSLIWNHLSISQNGQYAGAIGGNYVYLSVTRTPSTYTNNLIASGSAGIGTNAPGSILHLYKDPTCTFQLQTSAGDNGYVYSGYAFLSMTTNYSPSDTITNVGRGSSQIVLNSPTAGGTITLGTSPAINTAVLERMRIDASGNVGIGTNNPAYPLVVNGIMRATSVIHTNAGYYFGYNIPTVYQSTGTNNTSGTIYNGYNYMVFTSITQSPASFITTSGGKHYVPYNGVYTICYTSGTGTSNTGVLEMFISKNQYNSSGDLNTAGGVLAASLQPAGTAQMNISWSGYLTTTDFFCVGFYTPGGGGVGVRSSLAVTLVQRMG